MFVPGDKSPMSRGQGAGAFEPEETSNDDYGLPDAGPPAKGTYSHVKKGVGGDASNAGKNGAKGREPGSTAPFNWASLPTDLLIQYYDEIRQELPPTALSDMDMEEELLLQFHAMRALQTLVLNDDQIPLSQRVQASNSVSNVLKNLADMQERVYTSERYKSIENLVIRSLNRLDDAVSERFLAEYKQILEENS